MRPRTLALSWLALPLALAACRHAPVAVATEAAAPAEGMAPADDNLNAVLWMQASAEYRALARQAYQAAAARLDEALASPDWDALVPGERANPATGLPPAVIVDVDETVLDNSPYQARLVQDGLEYASGTWAAWVREQRARAVPGAVEFARAASERGVTIVYVTNRDESLQAATLANLRSVGLPVKDESVLLGRGTVVEGCESAGGDKACRRQWVGRHYRVLFQFGDQLGDFVTTTPETRAGHLALLERHGGWFGERWWMLPNPSYGGWESAAFGNDWSLPREARRAAKRDALDLAR